MTTRSWIRKLFATMGLPEPSRRSRPPALLPRPPRMHRGRRPSLELLEDRIVPATDTVDVAGLRFLASDGFQESGDDYFANTGTVSIGYTPATATENFLPLIQAKLLGNSGPQNAFTLQPHQTSPAFELADSELDLVVVGGSPTVPIPIWKSGPSFQSFDIGKLQSTGIELTQSLSDPITVADVDFKLSTLAFNNPDSGTTADAQVKMQGDASFDNVPLLKDAGISAHVGGPDDPQNNYVIADASGITLTGLDVTKDLPSNFTLAGLGVSGKVAIGYSHADNSFSFGGTVYLTTPVQGIDKKAALDNVSATLELSVSPGKPGKDISLSFGLGGSFKIFDLDVSTVNGQPLSFSYDTTTQDQHKYEIQGGLQLEFNGNTIAATLDDGMGGPGILIENGQLTQFNAVFNSDIHLFGATIDATNLTFQYSADNGHGQSQFEMYGDLSLTVPTTNQADTTITAHLGTQADPGLVLQNGTLTQINMGLSGAFDVFGFRITAAGANLEWQKADDSFLISGAFTADFKVFSASVTLGDSPTTGLVIKDGHFQLKVARFEVDNAPLGPVTLEKLVVAWQEEGTPGEFTIDVEGKVLLPGGLEVHAALVFDHGGLDSIAVSATGGEGIPIPGTGLFVTDLGGSIENLENPAQIIVSAHLGVTWGETFNLFGKEVKLFRAEGDITVDANELVLSGSVQLGAYSTDGGTTWQAAAGSGDAKLVLDWGDQLYSLHMDVNGMFGFIDLSGDLTFNVGKEIKFLATAAIVIPPEVPFIGGDKIAGVGFYFDHVFKHDNVDTSTTVAAWIELHIIWSFEVGFEYVYNDTYPNGHLALIGAGTIDNFKADVMPGPVDQSFTYTADLGGLVPAGATSATLSADWSKQAAGVTIVGQPKFRVQRTLPNGQTQTITEDQFAANGIQLIDDPHFSSPTKKAMQIVGSTTSAYTPITGDYKLLVDVTTEGGNPFPDYPNPNAADVLKIQATWHVPKPTFGPRNVLAPYALIVPPTPGGTFPVVLQGTIDDGFLTSGQAQVSLYRVLAGDPQQKGVLLGTLPLTRISGNGVNWQATVNVPIEGLYPLPYTVYAVVNDGFNVPVKTANSSPFTPEFAVIGSVSNQNHDAKTGWSVFLDYNRDGQRQNNEPLYPTSDPDGFYAFTPTFPASPEWDPVPVGKAFNVQLIVPAPENFAPVPPVPVTFDGENTEPVPFVVQEKSAIKGTVFDDVHGTGRKEGGTPIPAATVYLDLSHNGHRDPWEPTALTDVAGNYDFANQAPGTYTVALDLDSLSGDPVAAYNVPAGTVGVSSTFGSLFSYGMDFDVKEPILVTSLGLFDSGQTGWDVTIAAPYNVRLYNRKTHQGLAFREFTPGDPGTLMGGSRFKPIPSLLLPAGFQGTIVGNMPLDGKKYFGQYAYQPVTWTTNNDGGTVNFVGSGRFGANGSFPDTLDKGPANAYAAGSFLYSPAWVQTTPPSGTYAVTIDNSGFDLREGNDFGAALPAAIEGSLTGHPLTTGGRLDPVSEPLGGWTVNLRQNGAVIATTTTGADGGYHFDRLPPGTYSVEEVVQSGWRALVANPATVQPASITFSVQGGESATGKDFVHARLPTSGITGDVFEDGNRNGSRESGESGQTGTFVYLDTNGNGRYDAGEPVTTTVAGGAYGFDNLADGTYRVGVIPDYGKTITSSGGGFQDVTVQGGGVLGVDFGQSDRLLQPVADQHATVGTPLIVAPALTTAGMTDNRLVFTLEPGGPDGASIDPLTGRITWTPTSPGRYPVTVRVRDPFQPMRTETATFLVTVSPPPAPSGPFAVPVLERLVVNRNRRPGSRARVLGTTLIFNVPVNLDPRALRLVHHRPGNSKQDLSRWIQVVTVVQNGQTWAYLRFRSPRGGLLPRGRYSLVLQTDLLRNALTGAPLVAPPNGTAAGQACEPDRRRRIPRSNLAVSFAAPSHHRPQGGAAQRLAHGTVGAQGRHYLGRVFLLRQKPLNQAFGLGPLSLGLAARPVALRQG
jgi:hypothetical protein